MRYLVYSRISWVNAIFRSFVHWSLHKPSRKYWGLHRKTYSSWEIFLAIFCLLQSTFLETYTCLPRYQKLVSIITLVSYATEERFSIWPWDILHHITNTNKYFGLFQLCVDYYFLGWNLFKIIMIRRRSFKKSKCRLLSQQLTSIKWVEEFRTYLHQFLNHFQMHQNWSVQYMDYIKSRPKVSHGRRYLF